ncbi:hypothetical protein VP249E411_P0267 [Vibrio phage 249E41-1]|nr:hypothetical protein VP249E411_P0267 [Vibrio phage 249E41-1]CAH9017573.1 hypothetical protein VP193E371_P0266 [Vibrio phage 193E37-1]
MFAIIRVICPTPLPSHGASSPCVLCDGYFYYRQFNNEYSEVGCIPSAF